MYFQEKQCGVLTLPDAVQFCEANPSKIFRWCKAKRIVAFRHRGRNYYGLKSLREWMWFRRGHSIFRQEEKIPVWVKNNEVVQLETEVLKRQHLSNLKKPDAG